MSRTSRMVTPFESSRRLASACSMNGTFAGGGGAGVAAAALSVTVSVFLLECMMAKPTRPTTAMAAMAKTRLRFMTDRYIVSLQSIRDPAGRPLRFHSPAGHAEERRPRRARAALPDARVREGGNDLSRGRPGRTHPLRLCRPREDREIRRRARHHPGDPRPR